MASLARRARIEWICDKVYASCIQPDPSRLANTGAVTPTNSLRHKATKNSLAWAVDLEAGRLFTASIVRDALVRMLTKYELHLPSTVGFTSENWLDSTSKKLQKLLTRARKCTSAAMADDETQPWDIDAWGMDASEARPLVNAALVVSVCQSVDCYVLCGICCGRTPRSNGSSPAAPTLLLIADQANSWSHLSVL